MSRTLRLRHRVLEGPNIEQYLLTYALSSIYYIPPYTWNYQYIILDIKEDEEEGMGYFFSQQGSATKRLCKRVWTTPPCVTPTTEIGCQTSCTCRIKYTSVQHKGRKL